MARTFVAANSDYLSSSAPLVATSLTQASVEVWFGVSGYANDDHMLLTWSPTYWTTNSFAIIPNSSSGNFDVFMHQASLDLFSGVQIARSRIPTGTRHHLVVTLDRTVAGVSGFTGVGVYLNGAAIAADVNSPPAAAFSSDFGTQTLYAMASHSPLRYCDGVLAEVAFWATILSGADVTALYNSGAGRLATDVASGALAAYWKVCGDAAPEPPTVGTTSLTVNGAPAKYPHPIATCAAAADYTWLRYAR